LISLPASARPPEQRTILLALPSDATALPGATAFVELLAFRQLAAYDADTEFIPAPVRA